MATGRVSGIRMVAPPIAPKGRVSGVRLVGTPVTGSKGRVSTVRLVGVPPTAGKGRISMVRLTGSIGVTLAPFTARVVEPLETIDVTAVVTQGTATGYVWRVVSAPAGVTVTLNGTGAQRTFRSPGRISGAVIVLGVRAQNGSTLSPEVTATLNVRPQITWVRNHGGTWRPGPMIWQAITSGNNFRGYSDTYTDTY